MLKFIVEKISNNTRRVAVTENVDTRVLKHGIQFHILFLQKEGKGHFSKSTVLERLNEDIGFPVKSDRQSMNLFSRLFEEEVSRYQPSLRGRNCYSFQLKPAPNHTVQTKILKR
jgi:hypothetical protein